MATSNHHWLLFFTTAGRVYRTKAYNLPEASRDAKGGHVAGLLSFQPDEQIAQVLAIRDYEQAPYLVLATRSGLVKKTRLGDYNSPRQAGVIAINFREDDDELIGAELVERRRRHPARLPQGPGDPVHRRRRPAAPDGSRHQRRHGDEVPRRRLAALDVGDPRRAGRGRGGRRGRGRGRRTWPSSTSSPSPTAASPSARRISDYRTQSRGGLGIKAMSLANEDRGGLVGAFIVVEGDEILSITSGGQVVRSPIDDQFRATGRSTMGVKFVTPKNGDSVAVVARSVEKDAEVEEAVEEAIAEEAEAARRRADPSSRARTRTVQQSGPRTTPSGVQQIDADADA